MIIYYNKLCSIIYRFHKRSSPKERREGCSNNKLHSFDFIIRIGRKIHVIRKNAGFKREIKNQIKEISLI